METIEFIESTSPWFFPVFVFVFGACIGSFLNVCIYRLPKGESILWPASHSATGRPLSWWENVPILAWIYLGGKDRVTREKYSIRYPLVELITAILFVVCWLKYDPLVACVGMLFMVILIVCTFIDLDHMIIPDSFSVGGMLVGLIISFWVPTLHIDPKVTHYISDGFASGTLALISALVGAGLVFWIGELGEIAFRKPAMGLGDVKLVGCIGIFCGWQGAVFSLFGGAIIGCILLLPILLIQSLVQKMKSIGKQDSSDILDKKNEVGFGLEIPFGPMLAVGAIVYFLGADCWVDPYFLMITEIIFG